MQFQELGVCNVVALKADTVIQLNICLLGNSDKQKVFIRDLSLLLLLLLIGPLGMNHRNS